MILKIRVGFGIGLLGEKIPHILLCWGSGFENLEKIPSAKFQKSWGSGSGYENSEKNPEKIQSAKP